MRTSVLALIALCAACRRETPTQAIAASPPEESATPKHVEAPRDRTIDVTFVVASDTHFGFGGMEESNQRLIDRVNGLTGRSWPIGGNIGALSGLVITGDLTEWGKPEEWDRFLVHYGGLELPVFE